MVLVEIPSMECKTVEDIHIGVFNSNRLNEFLDSLSDTHVDLNLILELALENRRCIL